MDYTKYYTPNEIASVLINMIALSSPDKVIDICCGSCNLLNAAKTRWSSIRLYGVDITNNSGDDVVFFQEDGRKHSVDSSCKYPLVLANPPFVKMEKKGLYNCLYKHDMKGYVTSRLEIEMLFANLNLLDTNGVLIIIMPNSFVELERYANIRQYLAKNFNIMKIIRLPDDTFGAGEIRSYAIQIKNNYPKKRKSRYYTLKKLHSEIKVAEEESIPQQKMLTGDWIRTATNSAHPFPFIMRRGNISSNSFTQSGNPILHTSRKQHDWKPSIRYFNSKDTNGVLAEKGDIIVSRIGKSAGYWHKYDGENIYISDCLYRIKDPTGEIFKKLYRHTYNKELRGVTTRFITMSDFHNWYLSL